MTARARARIPVTAYPRGKTVATAPLSPILAFPVSIRTRGMTPMIPINRGKMFCQGFFSMGRSPIHEMIIATTINRRSKRGVVPVTSPAPSRKTTIRTAMEIAVQNFLVTSRPKTNQRQTKALLMKIPAPGPGNFKNPWTSPGAVPPGRIWGSP